LISQGKFLEAELMDIINIQRKFGSDKSSVHKAFGNDFENYEDKELPSESIDFLMKTAKEFAEMTGRFDAIEIYSDQKSELIVDGKDFSDFELKKLLTLADDFVSEENNKKSQNFTNFPCFCRKVWYY
jgi:hypothetical protein